MIDLTKILVDSNATLEETIKVFQEGNLRIVLVSNQNKLSGTVTDGDIRRALLNGINLNTKVTELMNSEPIFIDQPISRKDAIDLMREKDIFHLPIVNKKHEIIGIETLYNSSEERKIENPVFILAGGFGTRLYPLTKNTPKPMLKVGGKPILFTLIDRLIRQGFNKFYISTHYKSEQIKNYFEDGKRLNISINYIDEERPLGTAGSLGLLPKDIENLPILVINADLLTEINFIDLLTFHETSKAFATLCIKEYDYQIPYGVVKFKDDKFIEITEKPTYSYFINAGIYVFNREVLDQIPVNQFLNMDELIRKIKNKQKISVFPIHEYWLDIGRPEELHKAKKGINK